MCVCVCVSVYIRMCVRILVKLKGRLVYVETQENVNTQGFTVNSFLH